MITLAICVVAALIITIIWTKAEDHINEPKENVTEQEQPPQEVLPKREEPKQEDEAVKEDKPQEKPTTTDKTYKEFDGVSVPEAPAVDNTYFDDAVFIGDSVTDGIKAYGLMKNATVLANKGLNPSTMLTDAKIKTEDGYVTVLTALAQIQPPPKKIYILQGGNGIAWMSKEKIVELYGNLIDEVQKTCPDSTIYLQSILPVTPSYSNAANDISNGKIDEYNIEIAKLAQQKKVYYVNIAAALKDGTGALPEEASPTDGMHFGPTYYNKWFDYLKNHTVSE